VETRTPQRTRPTAAAIYGREVERSALRERKTVFVSETTWRHDVPASLRPNHQLDVQEPCGHISPPACHGKVQ